MKNEEKDELAAKEEAIKLISGLADEDVAVSINHDPNNPTCAFRKQLAAEIAAKAAAQGMAPEEYANGTKPQNSAP